MDCNAKTRWGHDIYSRTSNNRVTLLGWRKDMHNANGCSGTHVGYNLPQQYPRCFTCHNSAWLSGCTITSVSCRDSTRGKKNITPVLPIHICLRSRVLQLPLSGWDLSEGLEDAEPVPYSTRKNWVRVPEPRDTDWDESSNKARKGKKTCQEQWSPGAPWGGFCKCILFSLQAPPFSAQSDRKRLLETIWWQCDFHLHLMWVFQSACLYKKKKKSKVESL